jgi:hypothetical protein
MIHIGIKVVDCTAGKGYKVMSIRYRLLGGIENVTGSIRSTYP